MTADTDETPIFDYSDSIEMPDGTARRYRIGPECGDIFEIDDDFDGLTLTIEVTSPQEAIFLIDVLQAARAMMDVVAERFGRPTAEGDAP